MIRNFWRRLFQTGGVTMHENDIEDQTEVRDKVLGDTFVVGDISGGKSIAIGRGATSSVQVTPPKKGLAKFMEYLYQIDGVVPVTDADLSDQLTTWKLARFGDDLWLLMPAADWTDITQYCDVDEQGDSFKFGNETRKLVTDSKEMVSIYMAGTDPDTGVNININLKGL